MGVIKEIARNVVLIVFFASVLDMFLPKSSMAKYIQLIMGLFVIISILNPIMGLLTEDFQLKAFALEIDRGDMADVMNKGLDLQKDNEALAAEATISKMKGQVKALVTLIPGVDSANVEFVTAPDFLRTGEIKKIIIQVSAPSANKNKSDIEPIEINTSKEQQSILEKFPAETAQRIKETVSSFYGIDMNLIDVSTH